VTIEVTDQMIYAFAGEPEVTATDAHAIRVGLAAVLALAEQNQSDASGLTRGAAAARRIADRYGEKGKDRSRADWRMWTAMSAGARAVAVRLTELADAEDAS
jgi:hypothetical protein